MQASKLPASLSSLLSKNLPRLCRGGYMEGLKSLEEQKINNIIKERYCRFMRGVQL